MARPRCRRAPRPGGRRLGDRGRARLGERHAGARRREAEAAEPVDRVEHAVRPLVERVVRGDRRDAEAELAEGGEVLGRRSRRRDLQRADLPAIRVRPFDLGDRDVAGDRLAAAGEVGNRIGRVEDEIADEDEFCHEYQVSL